jgi:hypothetical protein
MRDRGVALEADEVDASLLLLLDVVDVRLEVDVLQCWLLSLPVHVGGET